MAGAASRPRLVWTNRARSLNLPFAFVPCKCPTSGAFGFASFLRGIDLVVLSGALNESPARAAVYRFAKWIPSLTRRAGRRRFARIGAAIPARRGYGLVSSNGRFRCLSGNRNPLPVSRCDSPRTRFLRRTLRRSRRASRQSSANSGFGAVPRARFSIPRAGASLSADVNPRATAFRSTRPDYSSGALWDIQIPTEPPGRFDAPCR